MTPGVITSGVDASVIPLGAIGGTITSVAGGEPVESLQTVAGGGGMILSLNGTSYSFDKHGTATLVRAVEKASGAVHF